MKHESDHPFIGCDQKYEDAGIVLFGAPYDLTASFRKGARFAPEQMRASSGDGIETYSPYQRKDLLDLSICDIGDLALQNETPQAMLEMIENAVSRMIGDGKLPVMIGGEHLVSLGAIRAITKTKGDLAIIHFDAHADLRDTLQNHKLSHGTVMRRVWEIVGDGRIFQFGIRSGQRDELDWAKSHVSTRFFDCKGIGEAVNRIGGSPVYLSIDLDVLDSSVMPGTGTPEAGGIMFGELISAILSASAANIVGADLVELSPPLDPGGASTVAACKALRELLLALR